MVYLSNGNAYWIKKKLKIGALLLTFTWVTSSCENTCYLPPLTDNSIWIDNHGDSLIYSMSDTMFVRIQNPTYNYFSYEIINTLKVSIKSDILNKQNDSLEYNEHYFLIFTNEFAPGKYNINFYGESEEIVTMKNKIGHSNFQIK